MIGAPAAVAQPGDTACAPGQVVIDGQCNVPDNNMNIAPAPPGGTGDPGMGGGGPVMGGGDPGMGGGGPVMGGGDPGMGGGGHAR